MGQKRSKVGGLEDRFGDYRNNLEKRYGVRGFEYFLIVEQIYIYCKIEYSRENELWLRVIIGVNDFCKCDVE